MPAFITNGPDIPENLLQWHEEGHVVFFCGAGISYPAHLPDFAGLVKALYKKLNVSPDRIQQTAIKAKQFDMAIGLLERDHIGGREAVRRTIAEILTPDLTSPTATVTHEALLTLAHKRNGQVRLVTTNFDRVFEEVIESKDLPVKRFEAPLLPVPKNRWDGLVYLHGLLSPKPTVRELDRLVVSSGDFGLAYLAERWAARFVADLFSEYCICFIGYGINDPVLRYMMDALAADRLLGESSPEMFAFGDCPKGRERDCIDEWRAKNVTAILYRKDREHTYLHKTLREWANVYRDGVRGKEMIIVQHATTPPVRPSRNDFAVDRVLWALTDELAAKRFAHLDPVPPLEWLEPLSEVRFKHKDLARFGVTPNTKKEDNLSFSIIRRPTPYARAHWMSVVDTTPRGSNWDGVMVHLAGWLTRHLNDPRLILWLTRQEEQLHESFADGVRREIERLHRLKQEGNKDEIKRILGAAPNAIPGPVMRTLWRLILSRRTKSRTRSLDLYDWLRQFKQDGLTPILRMDLREALMPCVKLREPFRWDQETGDSPAPERVRDLVDWEIVLSSDQVRSTLNDMRNSQAWQAALPNLLQDFTTLLRDALDLMRELGGADDRSDSSYIDQPSISEHPQNHHFRDWTILIDLTRDAWLATAKANPSHARLAAEAWWQVPYPLFKRLAFFAGENSDLIAPDEALSWLLADNHWWMWSGKTEREGMRLLVALTPKLNPQALTVIEQAVLQGPLREMFSEDIEPERWAALVDHDVWLRLAKMEAAGVTLGLSAKLKLDQLAQQHPTWQLAEDQRDEFPCWMSDGHEDRRFVCTPRRRRDLMEWLIEPHTDSWQEDDWRQRCRENFSTTACALCGLARRNEWPIEYWREALQAWSEGQLLSRSWRYMARVIDRAPDNVLQELSHSISWWLQMQAKTFEGQEGLFFSLSRRLLALEYGDTDAADDPVSRAINHPVGHVTQAILDWWYRKELKGSQGLGDEVGSLFTMLCDTSVDKFGHGRVLLSAHATALFYVDPKWTKVHLLPLFDWRISQAEARAAWEGFLWSPRVYRPLLEAMRQSLLETPEYYGRLGKHASQFADFLAFVALDRGDTFTVDELAQATRRLPSEGLESTAQAIVRALESAGEQRGEYWRNRVLPYLKSVWPTSTTVRTPTISGYFAHLCVAARDAFPEAVDLLRHWLQPLQDTGYPLHLLDQAKLCKQFPSDALTFLDAVLGDVTQWVPKEIVTCLNDIIGADQALANDPRFLRLIEFCRRRGML